MAYALPMGKWAKGEGSEPAVQNRGSTPVDLAALFARYKAPLNAYFLRRTRNVADAEDLTHDVFLRLSRLEGTAHVHNAEAFIFQTAVNLLRDRARRAQTRTASGEIAPPGEHDVVSGEPSPERVLQAKVELAKVMSALEALSEKTRTIFVLRRLEQMKCEDIAELYGISVSAVEQHITKALAHLAKTIGRP